MSERKLNRREFIKISTVGVIGAALAAAGVPGSSKGSIAAETKDPTINAVAYHEAPMLIVRVAAGTLPPVDQRLPQTPLIVSGKEIGAYGGSIRTIHKDITWFVNNYDLNVDRLLHYSDQDLRTIVPNIIESWQITSDGKGWTFHLRNGMRWSDGSPLTSEDIRFWWEDVIKYPGLGYTVPWSFRFGGVDMIVEIIDALTFKFTFAAPFGNFDAHLTRWHAANNVLLPSNYLKQFHAKYANQAELGLLIQQYGFQTWVELFNFMNSWGMGVWWSGPANITEIPVLGPWHIVDNPQEGQYLWERNPYYWKVDSVGNQLPYIDGLRYDFVNDDIAAKNKLIKGEIDLLGQHDVSIADYSFYLDHIDAGNYVIGDYLSCMTDRSILFPQHYIADDAVLTDIVNHPNFVKALSLAINREAINQSLFYGMATVGQMSVMPNSKYYKPQYGTAWAQYDPALANQLLDSMGLNQRDAQNFRLRPDGKRLTFTIEHTGESIGLASAALANQVANYWYQVGINAATLQLDSGTYGDHMLNYQVQCGMWMADRCTDLLWPIEPDWFIPTSGSGQGSACTAWGVWYQAVDRTDPNLIEPPQAIKTLYGYYEQMTTTLDEDQRVLLGQQILDWLAANPLEIGFILECPAPLLFHKSLRNLPPPKAPIGYDTYGLSTYHPETFYYHLPFRTYVPLVSR